jgi:hypothetical protein
MGLTLEWARKLAGLGGFHRKPESWVEVGNPVPQQLLAELTHYTSAQLGIEHNVMNDFMNIPNETVFLVEHHGGLYLVSTEGGKYARYVRYVGLASDVVI